MFVPAVRTTVAARSLNGMSQSTGPAALCGCKPPWVWTRACGAALTNPFRRHVCLPRPKLMPEGDRRSIAGPQPSVKDFPRPRGKRLQHPPAAPPLWMPPPLDRLRQVPVCCQRHGLAASRQQLPSAQLQARGWRLGHVLRVYQVLRGTIGGARGPQIQTGFQPYCASVPFRAPIPTRKAPKPVPQP